MSWPAKMTVAILLAVPAWAQQGHEPRPTAQNITNAFDGRRLLEIVADKDSRFKIPGGDHAPLLLVAGEAVTLRITAMQAKQVDREGSVHGFVLIDKKGNRVPGWNLQLKAGTQDYQLVVPPSPGDYEVVCNVICSADHEHMRLKVKVLPSQRSGEE